MRFLGRRGSRGFGRILFLSLALAAAGFPRPGGAEPWDYVRVGKDSREAPKSVSRHGKAQVDIRGDRLEIRIDATDADDGLPSSGAVTITGTVGSDETIKAVGTFLNTDGSPVQMTGRYIAREELQTRGGKLKIVTSRQIVFPYPQNAQFWVFVARDE
jgi:hypothetical protein